MKISHIASFIILVWATVFSSPGPETATYDNSTNILTLEFPDANTVSTRNVLLGRISISDGSNTYTLTGGTLPIENTNTNSLEISLVYGDIIDQLAQTIFGAAQTVEIWGNNTNQVDEIESFDINNCSISFEAGAFIDSDSLPSEAVTIPLVVVDSPLPTISGASYSATHNTLQIRFSTPAQFDQIGEDRSIDGGSGNSSLDPEIPNNDPGEDRNGNGVLDSEVNILPFKVGFVDGAQNSVSLEGIKAINQIQDSDTLDIQLTINDAKRLETALDLNSLSLNVSEGAFKDTSYNPFAASNLLMSASEDSLPLIADSAAYDYAKNEFYIYFRDSENSNFDISSSPAPVWGKIQIYNSSESFSLTTGTPSATGNSLKIKDLSLGVLGQLENLINYDDSGNIVDSVFCSLEDYAVYDRSENGNVSALKVPIRFYSGSSSSTYASPKPEKEDGRFVYYNAIDNILSFNWDTKIGTYKEVDVPDDDEIGLNDISSLSGISLYDHQNDDTLKLSSGRVWRSSDKKTILVELSEPDQVLVETHVNKDSLHFLLDYYAFASTKDNGTPIITRDSIAYVQYTADSTGPSVLSAQYDLDNKAFKIGLSQPVSKSNISTAGLRFQGVETSIFDGATITSSDSMDSYSSEIFIHLSESGSLIFDGVNDSNKISLTMYADADVFTGLDNATNSSDTISVAYGRNYWITSFEAFPSATVQQFCSIGYIGSQCDIYVDVASKASFTDSLLAVIGRAFEDTVQFDSTVSQYDGLNVSIASTVRSYTGTENDIDENGKVIFVLTDILDEFGLGRNDTQSSLFVHGYSTPDDTLANGQYSNGGEIIYIDTNPLDITSIDSDKNILLHAITHEYAKMALQHNKPNEEPWILEAVAQLMQKKIFGNTVFFGEGTAPSTSTGNQLTYLSTGVNKLKGRTDQYNVNIFFTYLQERLVASGLLNDPEWKIVNYICDTKKVGTGSVDTALVAVGSSLTFADYFADYGMACYLDVANINNNYNGKYTIDALNIQAAPSGKSAAALKWDKDGGYPAPFMFKNIAPWSYNWIIMQGYIVDIEGNIIYKSPDLSASDTLVFNGYDGIKFKVKKLVLKSGFLDAMNSDYEVVDFEIDTTNSYGHLPVTTNSDFAFKELGGTDAAPDTTTGAQVLMLMVAKIDDSPAPPTSDFWVSNILSQPDFSDLYGYQNQGAPNHLDLFVVSQRALYDTLGNESASVLFHTERDSGELTLSILHDDIAGFRSYHTSYEMSADAEYSFVFQGTDASGNAFTPDSLSVSTIYYNTSSRSILSVDKSSLILDPGALLVDQFLAGMIVPNKFLNNFPSGLSNISNIISFGPQDKTMNRASIITINSDYLSLDARLYQYYDNQWHNIGGIINDKSISAETSIFGKFVILEGNEHLPEATQLIIPKEFALHPNFPNPFNPITTLSFSLPEVSSVSISVIDILGRTIWSQEKNNLSPGTHRLIWTGKNKTGQSVSSGVYFIEMRTKDFITHRKILLMK